MQAPRHARCLVLWEERRPEDAIPAASQTASVCRICDRATSQGRSKDLRHNKCGGAVVAQDFSPAVVSMNRAAVLVGARLAHALVVEPLGRCALAAILAGFKRRKPRFARPLDERGDGAEQRILG